MDKDALNRQIGGDHYTRLAIRPTDFAMTNGWDAAAHALLKYITRHANKNGVEDLQKALHNVEMRESLRQPTGMESAFSVFNGAFVVQVNIQPHVDFDPRIPIERYISANGIEKPEADALLALDQWVTCQKKNQRLYAQAVTDAITAIINTRYGGINA